MILHNIFGYEPRRLTMRDERPVIGSKLMGQSRHRRTYRYTSCSFIVIYCLSSAWRCGSPRTPRQAENPTIGTRLSDHKCLIVPFGAEPSHKFDHSAGSILAELDGNRRPYTCHVRPSPQGAWPRCAKLRFAPVDSRCDDCVITSIYRLIATLPLVYVLFLFTAVGWGDLIPLAVLNCSQQQS